MFLIRLHVPFSFLLLPVLMGLSACGEEYHGVPESSWHVNERKAERIEGDFLLSLHLPIQDGLEIETSVRLFMQEYQLKPEQLTEWFLLEEKVILRLQTKGTIIRQMSQDPRISGVEINQKIGLQLSPFTQRRPRMADNGPKVELVRYQEPRHRNYQNKRIWILDSGIDITHPELNINQQLSRSFIGPANDISDPFGHGTHIAGLIGARQDGNGMVGIAPNIELIALKVLNEKGIGSLCGLLRSLEYASKNAQVGDILSISFGAKRSPLIDQAILSLTERNIKVVANQAYPNQNRKLFSPIGIEHPNLFVVFDSGTETPNYATFPHKKYISMSGQTFSAPQFAGLLATRSFPLSPKVIDLSKLEKRSTLLVQR